MTDGPSPRRFVLVTGMSGAGLSTTMKSLEDLGYEVLDNLPLFLFDLLIRESESRDRPLAIGIDSRTRDFAADALLTRLNALREQPGVAVQLICVDADDDVLLRRFIETRRRHPLALDRPIIDGIHNERTILEPLKAAADVVIDTSDLSIHDTRRIVAGHFGLDRTPDLGVFVTSFSYRKGLPRDADLVFDVRFLRNPHWDPNLRPSTGQDPRVAAYIEADPECAPFIERLTGFLAPLLPRYRMEGKSYLTIAIGCTGGKHRSVYIAERLAAWLANQGVDVGLSHRGLERALDEAATNA
jgi:RNase adapter protein RapZ